MQSEIGYYFVELIKLLLPLLPIALVLVAAILLRRAEQTRLTMWLLVITAVWLVVAIASRLTLSPAFRLRLLPLTSANARTARAQIDFYFQLSSVLFILEQVLFIIFAIVLLMLFRVRADSLRQKDV